MAGLGGRGGSKRPSQPHECGGGGGPPKRPRGPMPPSEPPPGFVQEAPLAAQPEGICLGHAMIVMGLNGLAAQVAQVIELLNRALSEQGPGHRGAIPTPGFPTLRSHVPTPTTPMSNQYQNPVVRPQGMPSLPSGASSSTWTPGPNFCVHCGDWIRGRVP